MNDIEIAKILKRPVVISERVNKAIDNALEEVAYKSTRARFMNFNAKVAAVLVCFVFTVTSVVYAIGYICNVIFEEPQMINEELEEERVLTPITEAEKEGIMDETQAIATVKCVVEKLGYKERNYLDIELTRSYDNDTDKYYLASFDDLTVQIKADDGTVTYMNDVNTSKLLKENDEITKEKAIEIANEIYETIGIENIKDYAVVTAKENDILFNSESNKYWEISYALNENDKDKFTVTYKIIDGKVYINILTFRDLNFDNNPIVITKDEAIKIALDKEKEFSSLDVNKYDAVLDIKKMNIFIYGLENNVTNHEGGIKINDVKRNVWVVYVEHKKDSKPKSGDVETVKELYNKKYYIDATTGEIIGGEQAEF